MKKLIMLSIALLLSACQSMKPYERQPANDKGNGEVGSVQIASADMKCSKNGTPGEIFSIRISPVDSDRIVVSLAENANDIDERYFSRRTWQQIVADEIPFHINFSAYSISLDRVYYPGISKLEGQIKSSKKNVKVTCSEIPEQSLKTKSSSRTPAQSKGNGEVGSVNTEIMTITPSQILRNLGEAQKKENVVYREKAVAQYDKAVINFRQLCTNIFPDQKVDFSQKNEMDKFRVTQTRTIELLKAVNDVSGVSESADMVKQTYDLITEINYVVQKMGAWGHPEWQKYAYPLCQAIK